MNFLKQLLLSNLRAKFVLPLALMMAVSMLMLSGYLLNRQTESFRSEFKPAVKQ